MSGFRLFFFFLFEIIDISFILMRYLVIVSIAAARSRGLVRQWIRLNPSEGTCATLDTFRLITEVFYLFMEGVSSVR